MRLLCQILGHEWVEEVNLSHGRIWYCKNCDLIYSQADCGSYYYYFLSPIVGPTDIKHSVFGRDYRKSDKRILK